MSAEGVIAIIAGLLAGSVALIGFGLDSAVEGFASVVIIWRVTGRAPGVGGNQRRGSAEPACPWLAAALLVGLLGNALLGVWWLDPAVALLVSAVAVREGVLAWRGERCGCCEHAIPAAPTAAPSCNDACCH